LDSSSILEEKDDVTDDDVRTVQRNGHGVGKFEKKGQKRKEVHGIATTKPIPKHTEKRSSNTFVVLC